MTDLKDEELQNKILDAFDIDELVVSEELISRTLEASRSVEQVSPDDETPVNPPVKTLSTRVTATYFGVLAAACLVIIAAVAVPTLMRPMGKASSKAAQMEMAAVETQAAEEEAAPTEEGEAPGSPGEPAAFTSQSVSSGSEMPTLEEKDLEAFSYVAEADPEASQNKAVEMDAAADSGAGSTEEVMADGAAKEPRRTEKTGIAPAKADEEDGINAVIDASSDAGDYFESRLKALIGKSCTKLSTSRVADGTGKASEILMKFKVNYADESYEIHSLWADGAYAIVRYFPADDSYNETDYITSDLDAFLNELVNMIN